MRFLNKVHSWEWQDTDHQDASAEALSELEAALRKELKPHGYSVAITFSKGKNWLVLNGKNYPIEREVLFEGDERTVVIDFGGKEEVELSFKDDGKDLKGVSSLLTALLYTKASVQAAKR